MKETPRRRITVKSSLHEISSYELGNRVAVRGRSFFPPAWRNVKYQNKRGTKCSSTDRGLFHSKNCNFPEESLIFCILCSQSYHGLGYRTGSVLLRM
jgi:hypothetical protein